MYVATSLAHYHHMKKPGTFSPYDPKKGPLKSPGAVKNTPPKEGAQFYEELAETGRPNWKKAPKEVRTRYRGVFMILFSIPIMLVPGWEIYRRVSGKSTKKVQQGEILEGQTVRRFSEEEKWRTEKDSMMYKIFGKDLFLDGFTKNSMAEYEEDANSKST